MEKYLNVNEYTNYLKRFAYVGNRETFDNRLLELTKIAEPENWYFSEKDGDQMSVIFYYIVHTFDRVFKQDKIVVDENETVAFANTGLLTNLGEEIYFSFSKSLTHDPEIPTSNYWFLRDFITENDRYFMTTGLEKPKLATYFSDYGELYFDPSLDISLNFEHIFGDRNERVPEELSVLPIEHARMIFNGFLEHTVKRIKRNNRIPVPQFYRDKIMFLIPVKILADRTIIIAVEKIGNQYLGNTTLTKNMAYNCARLLNKPESNWLLVE